MACLILILVSFLYAIASVMCMCIHRLISLDHDYSDTHGLQYSLIMKDVPSVTQCPQTLQYPEYRADKHCFQRELYEWGLIIKIRVIWPLRVLSNLKEQPVKPVMNEGVVFYVYSWDSCRKRNTYMQQLKFNVDSILEKDPKVGKRRHLIE